MRWMQYVMVMLLLMGGGQSARAEEHVMSRDQLFAYIATQERESSEVQHCAKVKADILHVMCFVKATGETGLCGYMSLFLSPEYKVNALDLSFGCLRAGVLKQRNIASNICEMVKDTTYPYFYEHCQAFVKGTVEGCLELRNMTERPSKTLYQNERDVVDCMLHHAQRLEDFSFCSAAQKYYDESKYQTFLHYSRAGLDGCPKSYVEDNKKSEKKS